MVWLKKARTMQSSKFFDSYNFYFLLKKSTNMTVQILREENKLKKLMGLIRIFLLFGSVSGKQLGIVSGINTTSHKSWKLLWIFF